MKIFNRLIMIIGLLIPIIAGLIFFRPLPIIPLSVEIDITRVEYNFMEYPKFMTTDVTYMVNLEKIASILSTHYTRRSFNNPFPTLTKDELWTISLWRGDDRVHVHLGEDNILYRSADDRIVYRILFPEQLMYELDMLVLNNLFHK